MKIVALFFVLMFQNAPQLPPEVQEAAQKNPRSNIFENVTRLLKGMQELGPWDKHYGYMMNAVEKVYQQNGWTSESDQFSLDVIREVESLPPMAIQQRFDTFVGILSDRYLLDERQETKLRNILARESNDMFAQHSGRIMQYALDAIQTRAAGEAFTPDKVAKWVELAGPVFDDGRRRLNVAAKEMMQELDPNQLETFSRDFQAASGRMTRMDELRHKWAKGEWRAADWGMDQDPIQMAAEARLGGESARPAEAAGKKPIPKRIEDETPAIADAGQAQTDVAPSEEAPEKPVNKPRPVGSAAQKNDPWAIYVQAFIDRFKFTEAQETRAWAIYGEVKPRVEKVNQRHIPKSVATGEAHAGVAAELQSKRDAELDRLFQQMKRRLDRLPTRAQRRGVSADDIPSPVAAQPGDVKKSP